MQRIPEKFSDLISVVRNLLDAGKHQEAMSLIRRAGADSAQLRNALGVCMMRAGEISKAIDLYRSLILNPASITVRTGTPDLFIVNFATALFLDGNPAGCLSTLGELSNRNDPAAVRLRMSVAKWKRSQGWLTRIRLAMGIVDMVKGTALDYPPGELPTDPKLRPAA